MKRQLIAATAAVATWARPESQRPRQKEIAPCHRSRSRVFGW